MNIFKVLLNFGEDLMKDPSEIISQFHGAGGITRIINGHRRSIAMATGRELK